MSSVALPSTGIQPPRLFEWQALVFPAIEATSHGCHCPVTEAAQLTGSEQAACSTTAQDQQRGIERWHHILDLQLQIATTQVDGRDRTASSYFISFADIDQQRPFGLQPNSTLGLNLRDLSAQGRKSDRKSTRLNSSHVAISYAVVCLKTKTTQSAGLRVRTRDPHTELSV